MVHQVVDHAEPDEQKRLSRGVEYGRRGQVVVHRLDETQFIPNMLERDSAIRIPPPPDDAVRGFVLDGLRDPRPLAEGLPQPALELY
jgi:thienamycin biosynthesis protein ThnN